MGVAASASAVANSTSCDSPVARAAEIRERLVQLPAELDRLEKHGPSGQLPIAALSRMLRTVREGQQILACGDPSHASALDQLHTRLWRLHARVRKGRSEATNSDALPIRVLALGDSITDGGTKLRSYRFHLHGILKRHGHDNVRWLGSMHGVFDKQQGRNASAGVVLRGPQHAEWPPAAQSHEGHWGWTSRQLLRGHERQAQRGSLHRWLKSYGAAERPDITLLHIGTNDLTKLVLKPNGPREPPAAVARRVQTVMQRLCAANPKMHVLVAAPLIPYCRAPSRPPQERLAQLARRREVEAEYARHLLPLCDADTRAARVGKGAKHRVPCESARVACVNMSAAVGCDQLVADGVHPAAAGARRMASAWYRQMQPRLRAIVAERESRAEV